MLHRCTERLAALLAAASIAGCALPPAGGPGQPLPPAAPPPPAPGTTPVPPPAPPPAGPALADEQRRLRQLLNGTPVVVELLPDGRLLVQVPLRHSFDSGRAAVKPALAAVLDQMAVGLRKQNTELRIAAPSDPGGSSMLAADRAASTRDYLVSRGVSALRFVSVGRGDRDDVIELVISERFMLPVGRLAR